MINGLKKILTVLTVSSIMLSSFAITASASDVSFISKPLVTPSNEASSGTANILESGTTLESDPSLPAKYSSVDSGFVSSVKNQGNLNSCWAFSTAATFETALLKKGITYDVSEEHMNHYITTRTNSAGTQFGAFRNYTDGGLTILALGYLASWVGARAEADIPYRSADSKTFDEIKNLGTADYGVTGAAMLSGDKGTIKQAIYSYGAVCAGYYDDDKYYSSENCSYFMPNGSSHTEAHAISIVGWDDNFSKANFNADYRPNSDGAWLIKNSWGIYNSMGGYFWISYEDGYLFSADFAPPITITDTHEINDKYHMVQIEDTGTTYGVTPIDQQGKVVDDYTFMNIFDFTEIYPYLGSVTFCCGIGNAGYTVYYIPLDTDGKPVTDDTKWTKLTSGTTSYAGYISADTSGFTLPVGKAAIGVKIDADKTSGVYSGNCLFVLGTDQELYPPLSSQTFYPDAKDNVSYMYSKIYGMDELSNYTKTYYGTSVGANFTIKAITSPKPGDVDLDGKLSALDVITIQRHLSEILQIPDKRIPVADVNNSGTLNLLDVTELQKMLAY